MTRIHAVVKSKLLWLASFVVLIGLAFPGIAAAQQSSTPSPLLPASPNASLVAGLYWIVFWMAVVVFILVEGLLIYAAVRFRRQSESEQPIQVHGNNRMELAWTIGPALIAAAIFVLSLQVMLTDQPPTADGVSSVSVASVCFNGDITPDQAAAFLSVSTLKVEITGKQWWWEMNYPDYGFYTATDMYVPVGDVVVLEMTSNDVVHSWWIPQLGGKRDVYPGATTYAWFQVTEPGVYEGHCTEFCGDSHAYMPMRVIALEPAAFDTWTEQQIAAAPEPATDLSKFGQQIFVEKGCNGCHTVNGLGGSARTGPNLSNLASRRQIAGIMPYNPENLRTWLIDPAGVKPGARMPNFNLSAAELDALVAYLDTLRTPVNTSVGTVEQQER
jgi:cytochrome c oxidase subunit 2